MGPPEGSLYYERMPPGPALLLLALAVGGLAGCRSGAPITWETAPAPTVRPDVVDERARFREIFCAVRDVRAREAPLPDDRPRAAALARSIEGDKGRGVPRASRRRVLDGQGASNAMRETAS